MDITRILVSPGRRYGNAVERNHIKRIGREIYRNHKFGIKPGYDIGFIFYPGSYTYDDRVNQILGLLKSSSLYGEDAIH